MINQSTIDSLKAMKLSAMATELEHQLEDPSAYRTLGFEERPRLLVDAEWNRRQANKFARYIKNAYFSAPNATIEGIEYHEDRKLDKAEILRFATCQYIQEGHHIILKGASGNGKTYLVCVLGHAACRKLKSVKYIRMPELLDELNIAKGCGIFKKTIKSYQKVDLLILDEWLIRPLLRCKTICNCLIPLNHSSGKFACPFFPKIAQCFSFIWHFQNFSAVGVRKNFSKYEAAVRYLEDLKAARELITPKKWRREVETLTAKKDLQYQDMRSMWEGIKAVEKLKKTLNSL